MRTLASLGVNKGKPYNPDAKTKDAMPQEVIDAYHYVQQRLLHPDDPARIWWPDKYWYDSLFHDQNGEFAYEYADRIDLDNRADRYYCGTSYPQRVGPKAAGQYLYALADSDGAALQSDKAYSFTMPAQVPVSQFWPVVVYDLETMALI